MTCPYTAARVQGPEAGTSSGVSRRGLVGGALGVAASTAVVGAAIGRAQAAAPSAATTPVTKAASAYPFQGVHQQGILTPAQRHAAFVSFDVTAANRDELRRRCAS